LPPEGTRAQPTWGIAGTGLIGASIGLRARAHGVRVLGFDASRAHAERAHERGALDATVDDVAELNACEVVVLAAPLEATLELLERLSAAPPAATLILDVCSVKLPVERAGRTLAAFVPTHPIAGSERSGPEAARADLFVERVWTHAPVREAELRARLHAFIGLMGARAVPLDSAAHDGIVALTSHAPQVLAVALAAHLGERLDEPAVLDLCGTGVRSMTRLGASSWPVWQGVLGANAAAVAQEVRAFSAILSDIADALAAGNAGRLGPQFERASDTVARLRENDPASGSVVGD
jgi:prephenate dehydrogenase